MGFKSSSGRRKGKKILKIVTYSKIKTNFTSHFTRLCNTNVWKKNICTSAQQKASESDGVTVTIYPTQQKYGWTAEWHSGDLSPRASTGQRSPLTTLPPVFSSQKPNNRSLGYREKEALETEALKVCTWEIELCHVRSDPLYSEQTHVTRYPFRQQKATGKEWWGHDRHLEKHENICWRWNIHTLQLHWFS